MSENVKGENFGLSVDVRETLIGDRNRFPYGVKPKRYLSPPSSGEDSDEDANSFFKKLPTV